VNVAITRTANFWNRKIVLCPTPTKKGASRNMPVVDYAVLNALVIMERPTADSQ